MLIINLEDDFIEKVPYEMAEEVHINKAMDIRFEYRCSFCENRLALRISNVAVKCPACGELMKQDNSIMIQYREQMNLTQKELAGKIGVSRNYISMIERGLKPIPDNLIKQIKKATQMI